MRYLLFISLFIHSFNAMAQEELKIEKGFDQKVLGEELGVFDDLTGELTATEVLIEKFKKIQSPRPNLGFSAGAFWLRTRVKNTSDLTEFLIQVNQPLLDTIEFFIYNDSGELITHQELGEAFPISNHEMAERNFRVPFTLNFGEEVTILLRIATNEQVALPVYIITPEASWIMARNADILFGGYFGLILIMMLYNFFIFLSVKDISYLIYVIYILFVGITQAALEGYTRLYLWPDNFWISSRSVYIFTALVSISSVVFLRNFLKTKIYAPILDRFGRYIFFYFAVIILTSLIDVNKTIHVASQFGIAVVAFYIFITTIIVYRKGYLPAKFFLLAWIILIFGIITYALKDAGLIASTLFTNYLLLFGSAVEVLFLSLALADRINILKKEKATSQADALRISLENENIIREQNISLEEKVNTRTIDLKNANTQLSQTLGELQSAQSQLVDAEKMASLGQLTAGIAHEINNPINFVIANIQPLKYDVSDLISVLDRYEGIASEAHFTESKNEIEKLKAKIDLEYTKQEIEQLLDGIQDGANRTAEIVKGLKDFSRLDETNLKYNDLNEGMESTMVILQSNLPHGLKIKKELGDIPKVECLGGKINQVFMNILNNSLQAMNSEKDRNDLELNIKSWHDQDFVYFSVSDNGPGINETIQRRIFEPFFTTKDVGEGTGLGLSIVFSIIELHKGTITVDSKVGEGAKFTIKLPIESQIEFKEET